MKQFKKALLLCCCIGILGSLTACGRSNTANTTEKNTTTNTSDGTTVEEKKSTESTNKTDGTTNKNGTTDTTVHENTRGDGVVDNVFGYIDMGSSSYNYPLVKNYIFEDLLYEDNNIDYGNDNPGGSRSDMYAFIPHECIALNYFLN